MYSIQNEEQQFSRDLYLSELHKESREFGLLTELIMKIDCLTEIEKLTFRGLALR